MDLVTAYLGLGSNLGNRESNLAAAAELLVLDRQVSITGASSVYETAPWGFTDQPAFLNCVLKVETSLEPVDLLARAQAVEAAVGREPSFRYGPRLIDVDILLYGDLALRLEKPDLQIPHPRMDQRAFVLVPLAELTAELVHPKLQVTVGELALKVAGRDSVKLWGPALNVRSIGDCGQAPI